MNHTQTELATQFWIQYIWNSTAPLERQDFFNFCESLCEATSRSVGKAVGIPPVIRSLPSEEKIRDIQDRLWTLELEVERWGGKRNAKYYHEDYVDELKSALEQLK